MRTDMFQQALEVGRCERQPQAKHDQCQGAKQKTGDDDGTVHGMNLFFVL